MMHSNNFVVCVLHNGKPVEESVGGVVALPFNSEYTIRLRNKHSRRAVAKVWIDEENVSEGGIVVQPQAFADLECHVTNKRKFQFVSADSPEAIDAGKNNKSDDSNGIIRVEWRLEVENIYYQVPVQVNPWWPSYPPTYPYLKSLDGGSDTSYGCNSNTVQPCGFTSEDSTTSRRSLAEGCTVEGGLSNQTFDLVHLNLEKTVTEIRVILRGYTPSAYKSETKFCSSCGAARTKKAKFCANCGNALQVYNRVDHRRK
jgi:hypothetical protein